MIGLALFFIMQTENSRKMYDKTSAYIFFVINLVFNTLWSFLFFGIQMPEFALLILVALIIDVVFMARAFYRINTGVHADGCRGKRPDHSAENGKTKAGCFDHKNIDRVSIAADHFSRNYSDQGGYC